VNAEIGRLGRTAIPMHRVVDTLDIARRKHPGAPASLDALCARYGIDTSDRTLHGALLDAKLLADVYIELTGGRQASLGLTNVSSPRASTGEGGKARQRPSPLSPRLSDNEKRAHAEFVAALGGTRAWARHVRGFDAATDQPPKPAND
ncbi:MAG: exonuclease domain-containing protein, partial [Pseudomonadota bacterium]